MDRKRQLYNPEMRPEGVNNMGPFFPLFRSVVSRIPQQRRGILGGLFPDVGQEQINAVPQFQRQPARPATSPIMPRMGGGSPFSAFAPGLGDLTQLRRGRGILGF